MTSVINEHLECLVPLADWGFECFFSQQVRATAHTHNVAIAVAN